MTCPTCNRKIEEGDERTGVDFGSWSEPSSTLEGCRFCCPDADDREAAYDDHVNRLIDEYRDEL